MTGVCGMLVRGVLALVVAMAVPVLPAASAPQVAQVDPGQLHRFMDDAVRQAMARDHVAGVVASVVLDGQILLSMGWGSASFEPNRPMDGADTLVRIGSIGKTMTWILALQQAEASRLDLDADINSQLPDGVRIGPGPGGPVSIRHIMAHQGGFEDRVFGHLFARSPDRIVAPDRWLMLRQPRRVRASGTHSSYSNFATALAGAAVVHVAGADDYPTLIENRIFGPLGMTSSTAREPYPPRADLPAPMPAALAPRLSGEFVWNGKQFVRRPAEYITQVMPAGGMYSTAGDMARFMAAILDDGQLDGARIYGPDTARALRTPLVPTGPCGNGWQHGFATRCTADGHRTLGHNGATLNYTTEMLLVPAARFGIFVAANSPTSGALTSEIAEAVVDRFIGPGLQASQPVEAGPPTSRIGHADPGGTYVHSRRAYRGLEAFLGVIGGQQHVRLDGGGRLVVDGQTWLPGRLPGTFVRPEQRSTLHFILAPDGRAVGFAPDHHGLIWEKGHWWENSMWLILLAAAVAIASVATPIAALAGRAAVRASPSRKAMRLAVLTAACWLVAMASFGWWGWRAEDPAAVAFDFPGGLLGTASVLAAVAGLLSLVQLAILARHVRVKGWRFWPTAALLAGALLSVALAGLLLALGALPPWH